MTAPSSSLPVAGSPDWIAGQTHSTRTACRLAQLHLAAEDERILSLEGDLAQPAVPFHLEHPHRFIQRGIAEADLVGMAAGLARRGRIPFVNSFAAFLALRACEQIRLSISYHRSNVKLAAYYGGISGGLAGPTHHCTEDLAILRALPNLTVVSPADAAEAYKATRAAAAWDGPVYLRLGRADTPRVYLEDYELTIGRAVTLRPGSDVTLAATGNLLVSEALKAGEELAAEGISCRVLNLHTVKPLDREAVLRAAEETRAIVTVEDHNVLGGLGSAVAQTVLAGRPVPVLRVGIEDRFCETVGPHEEMLALYGFDAAGIAAAARRALAIAERAAPTSNRPSIEVLMTHAG